MRKRTSLIEQLFFWGGLLGLSVYVLLPIGNMILASIKPLEEIQVTGANFLPSRYDLGTYVRMWKTVPLLGYIKNSFIIIGIATMLSVLISIFAGYVLQRFVFPGKKSFGNYLITAQMLPNFLLLLPIYLLFVAVRKYLGFPLVGTYQGVILTYMTFALPFSIWMMRGFFETIPRELEEAAYIDGCGVVRALFTIIVPVSVPGIISVALYSFLLGWEEVLFASVLTNKATRTVAVGLRNYSSTTSTYWNEMMAAAVAVTVPIVIMFLVLQRYFIKGLTAGSVKG